MTGPPDSAMKIDRFNKGEVKDVTGFRDPANELEKTSRPVERGGTGEPRRPCVAIRERQVGERGHRRFSG